MNSLEGLIAKAEKKADSVFENFKKDLDLVHLAMDKGVLKVSDTVNAHLVALKAELLADEAQVEAELAAIAPAPITTAAPSTAPAAPAAPVSPATVLKP
jgi:hypothetical protein